MAKKKALDFTIDQKRKLIEYDTTEMSLSRQCDLLSLSKGALYYEPVAIDPLNISIMEFIDLQHTKTPFYGSRKLVVALCKSGYAVNRKRVQRLMQLMGIRVCKIITFTFLRSSSGYLCTIFNRQILNVAKATLRFWLNQIEQI